MALIMLHINKKYMEHPGKVPPKDRNLDSPSEANRDKHVNFNEVEEKRDTEQDKEFLKNRRKEWREGLEEGRENHRETQ